VDSTAKMTAAFASCINPSSFFLPWAFHPHGTRHGPIAGSYLLGPIYGLTPFTIHCRGRTCTCEHVKD
jgi:hypothetical protein